MVSYSPVTCDEMTGGEYGFLISGHVYYVDQSESEEYDSE